MADTATKTTEKKPPPLHERIDVFDDIVAQYNGGNNLHLVQAEFRGAMRLLCGTAVPKGHEALTLTVETDASLIKMNDEKDFHDTVNWIESERLRNAAPKKSYTVEDVWPPKKTDEVGGSPPMDDSGIGNSKAEVLPVV